MKTCRVFFVILIIIYNVTCCFCQMTTGIPNIINFSKELYNAGTQNWEIVQDRNDIVYSANNEGLLRFDGTFWKLYPFQNNLIVRAIAIAKDNRIYAGGQNDFGYFAPDKSGKLLFTSLKSFLKQPDSSFNYIHDIIALNDEVFFRGRDKIFKYDHKTIKVYKHEAGWMFLGKHQNKAIAQNAENKLLVFSGGEWKPFLQHSVLPEKYLVTAIIPFGKDSSLVTTQKGEAYILTDDRITKFEVVGDPLKDNLILSAASVDDDLIAVGTNLGGCFIVNKQGEVIQNISRKDGLQNNTVISIFRDSRKNLWLGLENGIDFIATNNAITHVYPEKLNEGVGYSAIVYENELYIGTSNGLFKTPLPGLQAQLNKPFTFVPNSTGPVWSLTEIEGNLIAAKHEGAFAIKNGTAVPINTKTGYWKFLPLAGNNISPLIIAGRYHGIELLEYKNNSLSTIGELPDFNVSPRTMAIDNNNSIWVGSTFNGVYKIELKNNQFKPKYKRYAEIDGLPSHIKNRIFKIRNLIVSATEKGVFQYNAVTDKFEQSPFFSQFFKEKDIRLLKEDGDGNIWFIEGKSLGLVDFAHKKNQVIYFPELDGKMVSGNNLEFIYPYNRNNIFVGSEKGFYHINPEAYIKTNHVTKVKITSVEALSLKDSLLFGGYTASINNEYTQLQKAIPEVSSRLNSFHFEFSSPSYGYQPSVEYSFFLDGFDKQWSLWTKNAQKDYTNLPPGTFTFKVKAKTSLGGEINN